MKTSRTPLPRVDVRASLAAWEAFGVRCIKAPRATRRVPAATMPTTAPDTVPAPENLRRAAALKAAATRRARKAGAS